MWDLQTINDLNQIAADLIENNKPQRAAIEKVINLRMQPRYMITVDAVKADDAK